MRRDELKDKYSPSAEKLSTDEYIKKLERENQSLLKQVGKDEKLFDSIKTDLSHLPPTIPIKYPPPKLNHAELFPVLIVTDPHAEEHVRPEEMEGMAEYTFDIFKNRLIKTGSKAIELINIMRQASPIKKLSVFALGDWFLGSIHPQDLGYGDSVPLPVAVPKTGIAFGNMLRGLSAHFDRIDVHCMCGNHGRTTSKTTYKMYADRNWDMSVYLIAEEVTKECKNIFWNIPKSIMATVHVADWGCLISHSGEVAMTGRTPYYGIERIMQVERGLRLNTEKQFEYVFLGHWHHEALLDSNIVMCPSLIGDSQYGRYKLHKNARAEQLLTFFTKKHGMTARWPIKL